MSTAQIDVSLQTVVSTPLRLASAVTITAGVVRSGGGVPASIPRSQAYLWSRAWREQERANLADIDRGDYVEFTDPVELHRFLMGDDVDG